MSDPASLIVALTGVGALVLAQFTARRGEREKTRQLALEHQVAERLARRAEVDQALEHARQDATTAWLRVRERDTRIAELEQETRAQRRQFHAELAELRALVVSQIEDEATRTEREIEDHEEHP